MMLPPVAPLTGLFSLMLHRSLALSTHPPRLVILAWHPGTSAAAVTADRLTVHDADTAAAAAVDCCCLDTHSCLA